jgi:hypothetical protein
MSVSNAKADLPAWYSGVYTANRVKLFAKFKRLPPFPALLCRATCTLNHILVISPSLKSVAMEDFEEASYAGNMALSYVLSSLSIVHFLYEVCFVYVPKLALTHIHILLVL